jgi:hypothetical protein
MGVHGAEEAEGVIAMVSDWLELDAADSWVRHDSEIVSVLSSSLVLQNWGVPTTSEPSTWLSVTSLPGPATGAILRLIFGRANRNIPTASQSQSDCGLRARRQHLSRTDPLHAIFHPTAYL